jgi:uncharacterized membrane protein YfhO
MKDLSFKKSLLYFSVILIVLELLLYKDFIFGEYYFLYKDLGDDIYNMGYPELYSKIEALKIGHLPGFSFHTALGENKYPFYLEPVTLTVTYLFFKNDIASAFIWIQLFYNFFAGFFLFVFFRKKGIHFFAAGIGSVLFAFSGYMVGCSTWYLVQFSNDMMLFALFLLSLHYFQENKKVYLLTITTALIGMAYTSIILYFAFLLVVIYLLVNYDSNKSLKLRFQQLVKIGFAGLLGLGLASFILLSNLHQMLNSPRGKGMYPLMDELKQTPLQFADKTELTTVFLRLFSNNLQGIAENFLGWYNYFEAPFLYCGLLILLLIPQLFHFVDRRKQLIYGGILFFFILIIAVPLFRHSLWLFTGNYYRMIGMLATIVFIYFATMSFDFVIKQGKVYFKTLLLTIIGFLALLFTLKSQIAMDASPSIFIVIFFLIIYFTLLYFFGKKYLIHYFPHLLVGFIVLEIFIFATPTLQDRMLVTKDDVKVGKGFFDATKSIIKDIKRKDSSFFRIEKDFFSGNSRVFSYNEAQIQGFYGSSGYWAFHNSNYITFLKNIDSLNYQDELGSRFVKGIREIPEAMQLCGVKYFISNQDSLKKNQGEFEFLKSINGHSLYKLKNHRSLGFAFTNYITEKEFDKLTVGQKHKILNKSIVVEEKDVKMLTELKPYCQSVLNDSIPKQLLISSFKENEITGSIKIDQPSMLFISIPFDDGWKISVNGHETNKYKVFHGLTGVYLVKGNNKVEMTFLPPYKSIGFIISILSIIIGIIILYIRKIKKIKTK